MFLNKSNFFDVINSKYLLILLLCHDETPMCQIKYNSVNLGRYCRYLLITEKEKHRQQEDTSNSKRKNLKQTASHRQRNKKIPETLTGLELIIQGKVVTFIIQNLLRIFLGKLEYIPLRNETTTILDWPTTPTDTLFKIRRKLHKDDMITEAYLNWFPCNDALACGPYFWVGISNFILWTQFIVRAITNLHTNDLILNQKTQLSERKKH